MSAPTLLAGAEQELRDAMQWYEDERVGLGTEFLAAVDAALSSIGESPERFPKWAEHPRFRRHMLKHFPYAVFFRVLEDGPQVVAIAHSSRRPGYWTARVAPDRAHKPGETA